MAADQERNGSGRENWWRGHLERRRRLKWSRARYCRTNQLSVHQLTYWERKLTESADPDSSGVRGSASPEPAVRFLPVQVTGRAEQPGRRPEAALRLRVGPARIEVRAGFDPEVLRAVVRALGER